MSVEADVGASAGSREAAGRPYYARFSRRLRAIVIDWILALGLIFGALSIAASARNDDLSRPLGILVVAVLLLYEPVLVSVTGSTLGHYAANLRVVDDRHGGNPGFGKALARSALKAVLGWYSFLVIAATRRNQALHDLLTRSTVQIRDRAKARPHHYVTERRDLTAAGMPSGPRRLAVVCAYLLFVTVVYVVVLIVGAAAGAYSADCIDPEGAVLTHPAFRPACSAGENLLLSMSGLIWLAVCAACIGWGWRGKLFGARRHA
jgi:uncharacterized RDD family membrane protein YckC